MATRKPTQSLSDLVNRTEEDKKTTDQVVDDDKNYTQNETSVVTPAETTPEDNQGGTEIVDKEKGVDRQVDVDNNSDDDLGNPNGVTFGDKNVNVIDKTPADLAAESPAASQRRYGINDEVSDDVHNNPNIQVRKDEGVQQIPSGTHLHPDVARDNYNRSIGLQPENGAVTRNVTEFAYAEEAEHDDKGLKGTGVVTSTDDDERDIKRDNEDDLV